MKFVRADRKAKGQSVGKPAVNRPGDLIKERSSACLVGLLSDHWCSAGYQLLVAEHGLVGPPVLAPSSSSGNNHAVSLWAVALPCEVVPL